MVALSGEEVWGMCLMGGRNVFSLEKHEPVNTPIFASLLLVFQEAG